MIIMQCRYSTQPKKSGHVGTSSNPPTIQQRQLELSLSVISARSCMHEAVDLLVVSDTCRGVHCSRRAVGQADQNFYHQSLCLIFGVPSSFWTSFLHAYTNSGIYWAAVKELNLSYYIGETLLFTIMVT